MSILVVSTTIILFVIGLIGTFMPGVPGIGLIFAGILLYAYVDGFTAIHFSTVVALLALTILAVLAQYIGSVWATKYAGAKTKALLGTLIGSFIGTFGGPVGIFAGAFIGALIGALLEDTPPYKALHVAALSIVGIISGSLIQFFLSIVLIIAFLVAIFV